MPPVRESPALGLTGSVRQGRLEGPFQAALGFWMGPGPLDPRVATEEALWGGEWKRMRPDDLGEERSAQEHGCRT